MTTLTLELVNRTNQRHYALTKSVKNINAGTAAADASFPLPIPSGAPIPTAHLSAKDAQNISKIQAEWVKIQQLQDDKVALAERLERIVSRARDRGRVEWRRVGGMDVDDDELEVKVATPETIPTKRGKKAAPLAAQISAGLGTLSGSNSPRQGSMPPPPPPLPRSGAGSRAGSRGRGRGHSLAMSVEPEPEPEPEMMEVDIIDGTEVEADDQLYCFCQQKSFGEMVGCDNSLCKFEWASACAGRADDSSTSSASTSLRHYLRRGTAPTASRRSGSHQAMASGNARGARSKWEDVLFISCCNCTHITFDDTAAGTYARGADAPLLRHQSFLATTSSES